ncbi:MAG: hypothetical protein EOO61_00635 [Hymenobacter sp.]|nr:MAG: hypothetical protein EOO61_00635 [Hymenobacter sp.]
MFTFTKASFQIQHRIDSSCLLLWSCQRLFRPSRRHVYWSNHRYHWHLHSSTISQQVAKNVFLWQGRSWIRKGLETYFTFMIELIWGKQRILEVYLNVSEMGEGIFGIERAANIYFNKPAAALTRQEAALIAACLPNPKRLKVKPASNYVAARSRKIIQQMNFLSPDPDIRNIIGVTTKRKR